MVIYEVILLLYSTVLQYLIDREKAGTDYIYSDNDKSILLSMMDIINNKLGTRIQYLAELDAHQLPGAGEIVKSYIHRFESESVKSLLIPHLVFDKVDECDRLLLRMYQDFCKSDAYISGPNKPAPAHIYVRYDNGFRNLKSKRISNELMEVVSSPRNAFYLPYTVRMLASWKKPQLYELLLRYASGSCVLPRDVGLPENNEGYAPPFEFILRELRFTGIYGLRYYPTCEAINALKAYSLEEDADISNAAKKILKKWS